MTKRQLYPIPVGMISAEHQAQLRDLPERRGLLRRGSAPSVLMPPGSQRHPQRLYPASMRIVIVAAPDRRRPIAALRYVSRWLFRSFYAVGTVVVALGVVSLAALPGDPVLDLAIVALGLLCLAYPTGVAASVRRQQRRYVAMTIEYEIDEDGIITRADHGESKLRWTAIERVALLPDLLLLWVSRNQYFPIPIDGLSPTDRADLADLVEGRGSRTRLWTTSDPDPR